MVETVHDEITRLAGSIRALERELEVALTRRGVELNYRIHDGIVHFEEAVIARHNELTTKLLGVVLGARPAMAHPSGGTETLRNGIVIPAAPYRAASPASRPP